MLFKIIDIYKCNIIYCETAAGDHSARLAAVCFFSLVIRGLCRFTTQGRRAR